jgi:putative tricarboxylic transport membrane protein
MFLGFAATALLTARGYALGSAGRMGPGYFPTMLGLVLALVGAILVGRSFAISGEQVARIHPLPLAMIAGGVVLFGLLIEPLGLVIAVAVVTLMACLASRQRRLLEIVALCVAMAVFSVGLFVLALRLPLQVWPSIG